MARYPDSEKWLGQFLPEASIVQTILAQREGVSEAPGVDGIPRLFAFTPLRGARGAEDVYVSIGIPRAVAFAEADRILTQHLAAADGGARLVWLGALRPGSGPTRLEEEDAPPVTAAPPPPRNRAPPLDAPGGARGGSGAAAGTLGRLGPAQVATLATQVAGASRCRRR